MFKYQARYKKVKNENIGHIFVVEFVADERCSDAFMHHVANSYLMRTFTDRESWTLESVSAL